MSKVTVEVCIGTSCHLLGAMDISLALDELAREYADKIVISRRTCLENCGLGPNVCINGDQYGNMTSEELRRVIKQIWKAGSSGDESGQ